MKRVFKIKDKNGGYLEVQVLKSNNEVPEDLIWLHVKNGDTKEENGISMTPFEAKEIIYGLFKAMDYVLTKYKLHKFKVNK